MAEENELLKRPAFGNRFLTNSENVFQHNAWDRVSWDTDQEEQARKKVEENSTVLVDLDKQGEYECKANCFWNDFYHQHHNRFFKDRHWLFTEFPELALPVVSSNQVPNNLDKLSHCFEHATLIDDQVNDKKEKPQIKILEVGCGAGNTVFPILQINNNPELFVYCCDFSSEAVNLVKNHVDFDPTRCHPFICDVTAEHLDMPFLEESLDIIILIFVLSAVHPQKMKTAIINLVKYLRPGGLILLRDYGRYDMAQLRFKKGQCLSENFYVRGDGTRVYFFTQEELRELFLSAGLTEEMNIIDRRLQVNRCKLLKMYRVWIQCKYKKPL